MNEVEQTVERLTSFLTLRMEQMHRYHNHKETMAHAAVLVNFALVAGVLNADPWPPTWVPCIVISPNTTTLVGIVVIWFWIHVYVRWQLRNRRVAAIYVDAFLRVLRDWSWKRPSSEDLAVLVRETRGPCPVVELIDRVLIPMKTATVVSDEGIRDYPHAIVTALRKSATGAITGERVVTYASLFLGGVLFLRTLLAVL